MYCTVLLHSTHLLNVFIQEIDAGVIIQPPARQTDETKKWEEGGVQYEYVG